MGFFTLGPMGFSSTGFLKGPEWSRRMTAPFAGSVHGHTASAAIGAPMGVPSAHCMRHARRAIASHFPLDMFNESSSLVSNTMNSVVVVDAEEDGQQEQHFWPSDTHVDTSDDNSDSDGRSNAQLLITASDTSELYRPPAILTWTTGTNVAVEDRGSSAAHQLIHGLPPDQKQVVQSLEVIEQSEKMSGDDDEGYTSVASSSPHSDNLSPKNVAVAPVTVDNAATATTNSTSLASSSNLLWLLDFKLDFFNEANNNSSSNSNNNSEQRAVDGDQLEHDDLGHVVHHVGKEIVVCTSTNTAAAAAAAVKAASNADENAAVANLVEVNNLDDKDNLMEVNNLADKDNLMEHASKDWSRKPPFTYTDLITQALRDKRALTVSGIYAWITEKYGYFKSDDDRWKNSVRHNLSMNPHFRKGDKAKHGAGHLWVLAADWDISSEKMHVELSGEDETARAVQSILGKESRLIDQMRMQEAEESGKSKRSCDKENKQQVSKERGRRKRRRVTKLKADEQQDEQDGQHAMDSMSLLDGRLRQVMLRRESMTSPPTLCISPHKVHLSAEDSTAMDTIMSDAMKSVVNEKSVVVEPTNNTFVFSPMEQMEELDYHTNQAHFDISNGR